MVVSHADIVRLQGGAHVLLAVAGYNLARFQRPSPTGRHGSGPSSGPTLAVPAALWIGAVALVTGDYRWQTALLLNGLTGSARGATTGSSGSSRRLLGLLRRGQAGRAPLGPPVDAPVPYSAAVALGCLSRVRFALVGVEADRRALPGGVVLWCMALGWAAATAEPRSGDCRQPSATVLRRSASSVTRNARPSWWSGSCCSVDRAVPLPRPVAAVVQVVAAASLWIYLTQWQVYPGLEEAGHPYIAVLAALVVGILAHRAPGA